MSDYHWQEPKAHCFGLLLAGDAGEYFTANGYPETDNPILIVFNAGPTMIPFRLPMVRVTGHWRCLLDTAQPQQAAGELLIDIGGDFQMEPWTVTVFALALTRSD